MSLETFHLAVCQDCKPVLPVPFGEEADRDQWAKVHEEATGHRVERQVEMRFGGVIA